jgi:hypothetical protein
LDNCLCRDRRQPATASYLVSTLASLLVRKEGKCCYVLTTRPSKQNVLFPKNKPVNLHSKKHFGQTCFCHTGYLRVLLTHLITSSIPHLRYYYVVSRICIQRLPGLAGRQVSDTFPLPCARCHGLLSSSQPCIRALCRACQAHYLG